MTHMSPEWPRHNGNYVQNVLTPPTYTESHLVPIRRQRPMCSAKISPKLTSSLKKYTAVTTRFGQIESHNLIFIMPVVNTQHGGRTVRPAHISHWALCAMSIARGTFIYQRPFLCTLISRVQLISANPFVSVMSISGRNFCVACKTLWELVFGRNRVISRFPPKAFVVPWFILVSRLIHWTLTAPAGWFLKFCLLTLKFHKMTAQADFFLIKNWNEVKTSK